MVVIGSDGAQRLLIVFGSTSNLYVPCILGLFVCQRLSHTRIFEQPFFHGILSGHFPPCSFLLPSVPLSVLRGRKTFAVDHVLELVNFMDNKCDGLDDRENGPFSDLFLPQSADLFLLISF